jgi:hypothetical protein
MFGARYEADLEGDHVRDLEDDGVRGGVERGDDLQETVSLAHIRHVQFGHRLTEVPVSDNLPTADEIEDELLQYCDVLLGRVPSPVESPYLSLAEVATAYYARAQELDMLIHMEERVGSVTRAHPLYRTRTGSLRSFIEMAKKMAELGSRRLTQEQVITQQRLDADL